MPLVLTIMVSGSILNLTQLVLHLILIFVQRTILSVNSQIMSLIQMEGMVFVFSISFYPELTLARI